ncbi:thiamine pyrophosphate-dependent enzyme [Vibrio lentus]|nr:thiamine pyrophosphate-dependent enzyme [Vibrio lentus]
MLANIELWATQHIQPRDPQNFITSSGLRHYGNGYLQRWVHQLVVLMTQSILITSGDGSFMMNVQELGTLKRRQIPVKMVLLNNSRLGMVRQWQSLFFDA